jgi:two-component system chemotaxis response regulator CheB
MSGGSGKGAADKIRILVVDDSAYNRGALSQMLLSAGEVEIVGTARDGIDAIGKTLRLAPDVITLDLEMPNMDGYAFLRWLMKERPTPVLVISSRADSGSVFRAMELGAVDFLAKPEPRISRSIETLGGELIAKVRAFRHLEMSKVQSTVGLLDRGRSAPQAGGDGVSVIPPGPVEVVAVAASTGGPPALQAVLTSLPGDFPAGIVIAQHMPPGFTRSFAERLNRICALKVSEAAGGERVRPGAALIAPGGHHLLLRRDRLGLLAEIVPRSPADRHVPSADRLMTSVAEACGQAALGVVLTGMGSDGAAGAAAITAGGGRCIAESEESAVVFGMPQEAIRRGAVDRVLPLAKIAPEILQRCRVREAGA